MPSSKKSVFRVSLHIKALEIIDGEKFLGRIILRDGRAFTIIKGDRVVVVRRKKVLQPK
jgi:hypothetical protein